MTTRRKKLTLQTGATNSKIPYKPTNTTENYITNSHKNDVVPQKSPGPHRTQENEDVLTNVEKKMLGSSKIDGGNLDGEQPCKACEATSSSESDNDLIVPAESSSENVESGPETEKSISKDS